MPASSVSAQLRGIAAKATPGPWEQGDPWSLCGVMPERYGEGKCVHCHNIGTDPVWVGRADINGTVMLAHRHRSEPYAPDHLISAVDGSLVCGNYDYEAGGVLRPEDAHLISLAPELAVLLADTLDALAAMRALLVVDENGDAEQLAMEGWAPAWIAGSEVLARAVGLVGGSEEGFPEGFVWDEAEGRPVYRPTSTPGEEGGEQ